MIKKLFYLFFALALPLSSQAATAQSQTLPGSFGYYFVRAKEAIQLNLFTFKISSKANTLDSFASQRVAEMKSALTKNETGPIEQSLNRYDTQKTKALGYAEKSSDDAVMNQIRERTLQQQRELTILQQSLQDQNLQGRIVEVQKKTANEVKNTVTVVQGGNQANEVENEIKNVWYAPGTGPSDMKGDAPASWEYAAGTGPANVEGGTTGTGGVKYEGGSGQVIQGGASGTGGQTIQGNQQGVVGGETGTGGQKIEGNQGGTASGTSGGGQATQVVQ